VKKLTLSFICFLFFLAINGQSTRQELSQLGIFSPDDFGQSKVYLNQESALNEITISKTQTTRKTDTWSIRVYMGSGKGSREIAESKKNTFNSKYSSNEARLLYATPYFKVLVGNYKTRIEAESFRRKILNDFPNSSIEFTAASSKEK